MRQPATIDDLRQLYRGPSALVKGKVRPSLDPVSHAFIEHSPFLLLATTGSDGSVDVSPRGGPAGFVRVLDDGSIAIPDLNGNNLLDSLTNVVTTGRAATLFLHPGKDETLRVNGAAHVSIDPEVLASFPQELRPPKSAIVITPDQVFIHCAKAFRRGGVWDPPSWSMAGPDAVDVIACQLGFDAEPIRAGLEAGYASDLAEDRAPD